MHLCSSRREVAARSGCVLRRGGHEAAACSIKGLPGGARRLRYRGQENKAHEMKARVRPSGIATTRAMPAPLPVHATRSAAAGPIALIKPRTGRCPCPSSQSEQALSFAAAIAQPGGPPFAA